MMSRGPTPSALRPSTRFCKDTPSRITAMRLPRLSSIWILVRGTVWVLPVWEKAEGWNVKQQDGALRSALIAYGFDVDSQAAIERMTDGEIETLVLHEEGEIAAGRLLGSGWSLKLAGFAGKRAELLARAVRDNLADCLVTLPGLLQRGTEDSLHFWFSTFDGMRREMFPRLVENYATKGVGAGGTAILIDAAEAGRDHFTALGLRLLDMDEATIEALSHEPAAIAL